MKQAIRLLIIEFLKCQNIVECWGISSIVLLEDSVSFDVCGFQFQGRVIIEIAAEGYFIKLSNKAICNIVLEEVVSTLDFLIEVGDTYDDDIENWVKEQLMIVLFEE